MPLATHASTETIHDPRTHWNIETLREYLLTVIKANELLAANRDIANREALASALMSAEKAIAKAELASDKRFDAVNEFRGQMGDQQRSLMPRAETEALFKILHDKYDVVLRAQNDKIEKLEAELIEYRGTKRGVKDGAAWIIAAVGLVVTLISLGNLVANIYTNTKIP